MAIQEKTQSPEEQKKEQDVVRDRADKFADSLLSSLDLPQDQDEEPEEEKKPAKKKEREPEPEEEQDPVSEEDGEDKEEDSEEDEEVIPKSKFQKRIAAERNRVRVLEAKVAELEQKRSEPTSDRKAKLEAMTVDQLRQLKSDARIEWKSTEDIDRAKALDELVEEIDDIIRSGPQKFVQKQTVAYEKAAKEIMEDNDDIDFAKHGAEIKKIATDIYNKYQDLQRLERGQATALEMAFEHWKATRSGGKSKEMDLKRQNLKLKQKTSLDSGVGKGQRSVHSTDRAKSLAAAKSGDTNAKIDHLFKHVVDIDKLVPELREK